jgi:hypothetical protein
VTDLFIAIEGTALAAWVRESPSIWAYATILTLHTVGLAIVVGVNAVVDLRLLGLAPRIPPSSLPALFPIMWWGFALNFTTGLLLFMADATTKSGQRVFYVKLACITLALIIARTIAKRVGPANHLRQGYGGQEAGPHIDLSLRTLAIASLFLWAGAIVAGRLMAYL